MVTPYAAFLALCLQTADWGGIYMSFYGDRQDVYSDLMWRYAKELHHTLNGDEEAIVIAQHEATKVMLGLSGMQMTQKIKACRKKVFNEDFDFGTVPQATGK